MSEGESGWRALPIHPVEASGTFWLLSAEAFASDKAYARSNGKLLVPFRMPYFWCCEIRGEGGFLNLDLPAEFRGMKEFKDSADLTITPQRFEELKARLLRSPLLTDLRPGDLRRGTSLGPVQFRPPKAGSDFSWAGGGTCFLAKEKFVAIITAAAGEAVSTRPVEGGYHLVFVTARGLPPVERRIGLICPDCGFEHSGRNKSEFIFQKDMWPRTPIFSIGSTHCIAITDDLKKELESHSPSNLVFRKVGIGEPF